MKRSLILFSVLFSLGALADAEIPDRLSNSILQTVKHYKESQEKAKKAEANLLALQEACKFVVEHMAPKADAPEMLAHHVMLSEDPAPAAELPKTDL